MTAAPESPRDEAAAPRRVFQLIQGAWAAQITAAFARLGVADVLRPGPRSSQTIADACRAHPDALHRLLRAAASIGLCTQLDSEDFALTEVGACLRTDAPGTLKDLVIAQLGPAHWLPWGRLWEAVQTNQPMSIATLGMDPWEYYRKNPDELGWLTRGMSNLSRLAVAEILAAYDFSEFERIADIGGGDGTLLGSILERYPRARGILFDRPEVIARAQAQKQPQGVDLRLECVAGDFFQGVPAGAAVYLLKSILHDWDDPRAADILRSVRRAAPTAKVLVLEMVVPPEPSPIALLDVNMMVLLGGRERTREEFARLFESAGYRLERLVATRGLFGVLEATPHRASRP
jgi:hypothetical protein